MTRPPVFPPSTVATTRPPVFPPSSCQLTPREALHQKAEAGPLSADEYIAAVTLVNAFNREQWKKLRWLRHKLRLNLLDVEGTFHDMWCLIQLFQFIVLVWNISAIKERPFSRECDQCQISPAASSEILHHTVCRTILFIAYSGGRWLHNKFSLPHSYIFSLKSWENVLSELRSERVKFTPRVRRK